MADGAPFPDCKGTACYYRYDVAHMAYYTDNQGYMTSDVGIETCTYADNICSNWKINYWEDYSCSGVVPSKKINCINGNDIFAIVGDDEKILRSTNKGVSWTAQLLALRRT
jgi:hypothetical protein